MSEALRRVFGSGSSNFKIRSLASGGTSFSSFGQRIPGKNTKEIECVSSEQKTPKKAPRLTAIQDVLEDQLGGFVSEGRVAADEFKQTDPECPPIYFRSYFWGVEATTLFMTRKEPRKSSINKKNTMSRSKEQLGRQIIRGTENGLAGNRLLDPGS